MFDHQLPLNTTTRLPEVLFEPVNCLNCHRGREVRLRNSFHKDFSSRTSNIEGRTAVHNLLSRDSQEPTRGTPTRGTVRGWVSGASSAEVAIGRYSETAGKGGFRPVGLPPRPASK